MDNNKLIDEFHKLWYNEAGRTWENTYWMGFPLEKNPLDLHVYQEIIHETKPDIIIETGTGRGGSALFLANMLDLMYLSNYQKGKVVTVDIEIREGKERPIHPRITYLIGSSISDDIFNTVKSLSNGNVMVVLDSSHSRVHVLKELELYSRLINIGSYIIVEDSNISGHPVGDSNGAGPMEAIEEFVNTHSGKKFTVDKEREKYFMTWNPNGYLRRTS